MPQGQSTPASVLPPGFDHLEVGTVVVLFLQIPALILFALCKRRCYARTRLTHNVNNIQ